jgi:hypothetical protein
MDLLKLSCAVQCPLCAHAPPIEYICDRQPDGGGVKQEHNLSLLILGLALVFLLALNAFFVLAEFAIVKVRPSRVTQLAAAGDKRAVLVRT